MNDHASLAPANSTTPDFSVVIVCLNNKQYLEPCLRSLYDAGLKHRFDVVVTDNGSTDGAQAMVREKFPDVQLIQNDHNVGLSRACNQGIRATCGRYVLLLNDDTLVNAASLDALVDFLDAHPHAGAAGGRLLNPDGTVQSCYNNFSTLTEEFLIATQLGEWLRPGYPAVMEDHKLRQVGWITSACLLVRRAAFDQIGLLDEEFFIYGDEADLQYRLKQAGLPVYYVPTATTIHYGGRSMNRWRRRKMVYRGKMLFYKKNYGALQTGILRLMLGVLSVLKLNAWGIAFLVPRWRDRAWKEINSNLEVVRLCWKLA
ncbi:MAG: glycosyltransferase family 2 protein [Chloroflexi bacterium]|nr:glycosyltransferase family 2 protein [Chloroflexota bacterium]